MTKLEMITSLKDMLHKYYLESKDTPEDDFRFLFEDFQDKLL